MATLIHQSTRKKLVVRAAHTFGRNPASAQTVLLASDTSQINASIRWNNQRWELLDHSRNGSFIDGRRLPANTWAEISVGQILQFGHSPDSLWQVFDLNPPATLLFALDDDVPPKLLNPIQNLLPNDEAPEFSVHIANTGLWVMENENGVVNLRDGETLHFAGKRWEFVCSPQLQETVDMRSTKRDEVHQVRFHFHASQNEEHVSLQIEIGERKIDLAERTHHYSLLMLARQRLADKQRGLDQVSQGWLALSQLSQMLGLEIAHINIQIFRARNQLMQTIPEALTWPELVERRRGEVRFGALNFSIVHGNQREGELDINS